MALILAVVAIVLLTVGATLIYVPAGVITAGLAALCAAYIVRFAQKAG